MDYPPNNRQPKKDSNHVLDGAVTASMVGLFTSYWLPNIQSAALGAIVFCFAVHVFRILRGIPPHI